MFYYKYVDKNNEVITVQESEEPIIINDSHWIEITETEYNKLDLEI